MPEPSKPRKPQGGTPQSDALPVVLIPGRGVDIGTAYIAAGQMHDDNANMSQAAIRDCFITLPADEASNLMMGGVDFRMSEDEEHCIVVGDAAIELAAIHAIPLRRPLAQGFISDKEDLGKEVVNIILGQLLGNPQPRGELAVYSVPGPILGESSTRAQYHTRFFGDRLKDLGFTPMPINEAAAVVYSDTERQARAMAAMSETERSKHTAASGLGISFGAGMINVALVHRGLLVRAFSLPFGGDFIDESAAKATNTPVAQVTLLKEEGLDLNHNRLAGEAKPYHDATTHRQVEALCLMYRELLTKLRDALVDFFSRPDNRVGDVKHVLPVIVSGGTSRPAGFLDLFDEIVLKDLDLRFPTATSATHVTDPMGTVTAGAVVCARTRLEAPKK